MRTSAFLGTVLLVTAVSPLGLASISATAAPSDCTDDLALNSTIDLVDASPALWDVNANGSVANGALLDAGGEPLRSDAYDNFPAFAVDDGTNGREAYANATATCTYEVDGRQVAFPVQTTSGGLELSRKVYVPASGPGFARFYNQVRNPGATAVTLTLFTADGETGDLGSDDGTSVIDRSPAAPDPGAGVLATPISWFATTDGTLDDRDPDLAHNLDGGTTQSGSGVRDRVDAVTEERDSLANLNFEYHDVTVAPGATVAYVSFEAMRSSVAGSITAARYLDAQPDKIFAGLTSAEIAAIQNWAPFDRDGDGVANAVDNCGFANSDQSDLDQDGQGDVCDADIDGDGIVNDVETAFGTDPRRADTDGDGVRDRADNCPKIAGAGADGCPVTTGPVVVSNVRGSSATKVQASTSKKGPVKIKTKGSVSATGAPGARDCLNGKVQVVVKVGRLAVSNRIVSLTSTCAFASKVRLDEPRDQVRKVKVKGYFLGSDGLLPSQRTVTLG